MQKKTLILPVGWSAKLDLSDYEKNRDSQSLRTGCRGDYLDPGVEAAGGWRN